MINAQLVAFAIKQSCSIHSHQWDALKANFDTSLAEPFLSVQPMGIYSMAEEPEGRLANVLTGEIAIAG